VAQPNTASERPELVFALVGAAGVRLDDLLGCLKAELSEFAYESIDIRLSALLGAFSWTAAQEALTEFDRVRYLQNKGDAFRECLGDGAAMARAGIAAIRTERAKISGSPDTPAWGRAYILRQLKHPEEADLLREVYGTSFVLVAAHAPRSARIKELASRMARIAAAPGQEQSFEAKATEVIEIDEKQDSEFGQNTRDTYPKADFFANLGISRGENEVGRFIRLLFGHPFHTPTVDEYAMYQASAAALRSSDDNRQVGAVIVDVTRGADGKPRNADIIASGMNEVPRGGGGVYWDQDSPDNRDQALLERGVDRAAEIKLSALAELIDRMKQANWLEESVAMSDAKELARDLLPSLRRTQFLDIGEFSRPVHAEMSTLIDAARRGVAVDGQTMYVTTFPCHNCAKHVIAAGLRKVVYLEPYPKSRARNLHGEEMEWESKDGKVEDGKVVFFAFTGIAPRQFRQLFSMTDRGAKKGRPMKTWIADRRLLLPRHVARGASRVYLQEERSALEKLPSDKYRWHKEQLCPSVQH
jgi:cytidine deaminase